MSAPQASFGRDDVAIRGIDIESREASIQLSNHMANSYFQD